MGSQHLASTHTPPGRRPHQSRRGVGRLAANTDGEGSGGGASGGGAPAPSAPTRPRPPLQPAIPPRRTGSGGPPPPGGPPPGGDGDDDDVPLLARLPPRIARTLLTMVDYGGVYGTVAVLAGWLTHIDPFGGLHWSADDALTGLRLIAPLLLFDALLMLPDWSRIGEDGSAEGASRRIPGARLSEILEGAELPDGPVSLAGSAAGADGSGSGDGSAVVEALERARNAMELLQGFYIRSNPGQGLSIPQEGAIILVGSLADEMLYRAVLLTLLGRWISDRLYEAGADDIVHLPGSSLSLPTPDFGALLGVALIASLGVTAYVARAWRNDRLVRSIQVLAEKPQDTSRQQRNEAVQRLAPPPRAPEGRAGAEGGGGGGERRRGRISEEQAAAIKAQLVRQAGDSSLALHVVEGAREVALGVIAGVAFLSTGNLGAPLAGALAAQVLFSGYQRLGLSRQVARRRKVLEVMAARAAKVKAAMAATMAARKARGEGEVAVAGEDAGAAGREVAAAAAVDSGSSGGEAGPGSSLMAQELRAVVDVRAAEESQHGGGAAAALGVAGTISSAESGGGAAGVHSGDGGGGAEAGVLPGGAVAPAAAAAAAAAVAAKRQRLEVLLEDMLRSPEGQRFVARMMGPGRSSSSGSMASSSGGGSVSSYIDSLLSDPDTKEVLLKELESHLVQRGREESGVEEAEDGKGEGRGEGGSAGSGSQRGS